MGDQSEKKASPAEVAGQIGAIVYNAAQDVTITDAELKDFAGRQKLREGFKKPMIEALQQCGYAVSVGKDVMTISPPPEDRPLTFAQACAESQQAQETGWRNSRSGGQINAVLLPDGSGFRD